MNLSSEAREKALLELEKKKLESLRRQAQALKALRDRTQEVEEQRKKREDSIMGRLNGSILNREIKDWYGPEAKNTAVGNYTLPKAMPSPASYIRPQIKPRLLDDIIARRRQEHESKQADIHGNLKMLNIEKQKILIEREKLLDRKRNLMNPTPYSVLDTFHFPSRQPSQRSNSVISEKSLWLPSDRHLESVHSDRSIIRRARQDLPPMQSQLRKLRESYDRERNKINNTPYMGERGINSYEPWQYEDYYLIRELVLELVDKVLDDYHRKAYPAADYGIAEQLAAEEESRAELFKKFHGSDKAIQLITEELLLSMTRQMTRDIVLEYETLQRMAKKMAYHLTMNTAEHIATNDPKGRTEDDPAYNMITKTHLANVKDREKKRKDTWLHTQPVRTLAPRPVQAPQPPIQQQQPKQQPKQQPQPTPQQPPPPPPEEKKQEDTDVRILKFHNIIPNDQRPDNGYSVTYRLYRDKESNYWKEIYSDPGEIKVGKKLGGIQSCAVSPNQRFLALGFTHGDLLVYDLWYSPPRAVRYVNSARPESDPVSSIAWSLDSSQITTINESGSLVLWSMTAEGASQKDVKDLEIRQEKDGILPSQLTQKAVLEAEKYDFNFQQGDLAESGSQSAVYGPVLADFHPAFTMLATQRHVVVGLNNGDILRCDMERKSVDTTQNAFVSTEKVYQKNVETDKPSNLIGQEIPAELFRGHKGQLIYIGFIKNNGHMVTVDEQGYIFIWRYHKKNLSHFEWFEPYKKYRLELSERAFVPTPNVGSKMFFQEPPPSRSSKKSKKSKRSSDQTGDPIVEADRAQAEQRIRNANLYNQSPWHEELDQQTQLVTYVYTPKDVSDSGAMFHIIQRHASSGSLSSYFMRHYTPAKNNVSKVLCCKQTPAGRELIFMLLLPSHEPKGPHITIVSVDLTKMKMSDLNILIELSEDQFQQCQYEDVCSFDISRLHDATGSDYIVCNVNGSLTVYSMNTGRLIMTSQPSGDFVGMVIDPRIAKVNPTSQILVASSGGQITILQCPRRFTSEKQTLVSVLNLLDKNGAQTRKDIWKTFNTWDDHPIKAPIEQTSRRNQWTMDGDPDRHTVLYMRQLVLGLVDFAMQNVDGDFPPEALDEYAKEDRIQPFLTAVQVQEESEVGSLYPGATSRAPSRAPSLLSQQNNTAAPSRQLSQRSLQGMQQGGTNPPVP
ncbi:uncharacterized protein [Ptychodera flava]|uniref:uncharacterized protein n=1 Tax=Ptychodera flava TaxID=63121 RepID=UPI00396A08EE